MADRTRPARQHQEGGLKSIFRVLVVMKDAAAYTQDHGPMTANQLRKRRFLTQCKETIQ
jgi:hypothetical protein